MLDAAGTTSLVKYAYDAFSRLVSAAPASGTATLRVYDGWNPIAEYAGQELGKTYLWGMDLSGTMQGAGGVGGLLAVRIHGTGTSAGLYHPTYDGNGNISEPERSGDGHARRRVPAGRRSRQYLTPGGSVAAHYEYDPFGNDITPSNRAGTAHNAFAHRFSTKPIDPVTGLLYYGYRWYDPLTGRWPSRDPIEEDGGVNLYGFVGNDAIYYVDILGWDIIGGDNIVINDGVDDFDEGWGGPFARSDNLNKTGEEAAKEAYKRTKDDPESFEYCGSICCKDGRFFATPPIKYKDISRRSNCRPKDSPCPPNSKTVGIYHSHPDRSNNDTVPNDFSYDDYGILNDWESDFLGNQNGVQKVTKIIRKDKNGVESPTPITTRIENGKETPYEPQNNGIRGDQGLPPLPNGTTDPYEGMRQ